MNEMPKPEAEDPQNKRFFKRTRLEVSVAYKLIRGDGQGQPGGMIAQTINVSAGGLLILTKEPLPLNETLNVALDIYQNNKPIRMICRIVRCQPSKNEGSFEVGLMFVLLGIEERRRLKEHVEKQPS